MLFNIERNFERCCNLRLNWWGPTSNLKLPFSDSSRTNNHLHYLLVYNGKCQHIFPARHSGKINVTAWFLVLPTDIKKHLCRLSRGSFIYICIYILLYRVLGIMYSRSLLLYIEIYRVGDNGRTVNTSTSPHISEQLGTENVCETLLLIYRNALSSGL